MIINSKPAFTATVYLIFLFALQGGFPECDMRKSLRHDDCKLYILVLQSITGTKIV